MPPEELLVRSLAWLSFAGYCAATAARLTAVQSTSGILPLPTRQDAACTAIDERRWRFARAAWTFGCVLYLSHVACAYHFVHHWSHVAAIEFTARRTYQTIGIDWGGGLYVNHFYLAVWVVDVILWWRGGALSPARRNRRVEAALQFFFAFMWFNATVVFGTGPIRWVGAAATMLLAALAIPRMPRKNAPT